MNNNEDMKQYVYIQNFQGILGNIKKIGNLSIGDHNSNSVYERGVVSSQGLMNQKSSNSSNYNFLNYIQKLLIPKMSITLNENNAILKPKKTAEMIQKIIKYSQDGKNFLVTINPIKYKRAYIKTKDRKDKNLIYSMMVSNQKSVNKIENILNQSVPFLLEQYGIYEISLILEGVIEYYKEKEYVSNSYHKISLGSETDTFYCVILIDEKAMQDLEDKFNRPYYIVDFSSGYDIHDLSYEVRYKQAIPAILIEMADKDIDFNNISKYLHLKIGN